MSAYQPSHLGHSVYIMQPTYVLCCWLVLGYWLATKRLFRPLPRPYSHLSVACSAEKYERSWYISLVISKIAKMFKTKMWHFVCCLSNNTFNTCCVWQQPPPPPPPPAGYIYTVWTPCAHPQLSTILSIDVTRVKLCARLPLLSVLQVTGSWAGGLAMRLVFMVICHIGGESCPTTMIMWKLVQEMSQTCCCQHDQCWP